MASLFIDPFILACPRENCSEQDFNDFVNRLIDWQELKDCDWTDIYISKRSTEILFQENRYPLWGHLQKIIDLFGIDYIQPKDVVNLVDAFLDKFQKIEETLKINDALFDPYETEPKIVRDSIRFQEILCETLAFMSLKCHLYEEESKNQILISNTEVKMIGIKTTIVLLDIAEKNRLQVGHFIDSKFTCCSSLEELTLCINTVLLWKKCATVNAFNKVVSVHTLMRASLTGIKRNSQDLNFKFLKNFLTTVGTLHFDKEEGKITRLLNAISDVLLDVNLPSTHALRLNKGGNSVQIEIGGFKAFRKDIDYEYHLHYWKNGGKISFSKVVVHNDFSIDNP